MQYPPASTHGRDGAGEQWRGCWHSAPLLGHRNLQTTQRYAELSGETVRHELDTFARRKTRTR